MKKGIHPTWYSDCAVTCACSSTFTTGSTYKTLQVDICSACHPFFTGEMKFVDTQGRVDRFMQKVQKAEAKKSTKSAKKTAQAPTGPVKSYKQLLQDQKTVLKSKSKAPVTDEQPVA